MISKVTLLFLFFSTLGIVTGIPKGFNYEESEVPNYSLNNPIEGVSKKEDWPKRRQFLYELVESNMFGKAPEFDRKSLKVTIDTQDISILDGKGIMSQPLLTFANKEVRLLIFRPKLSTVPVPAFLGYNFNGNHTVHSEESIKITEEWVPRKKDNKASEGDRGTSSSRWDVSSIIESGYALITVYCGEVDPDFHDEFKNGIHANYPKPKPHEWGTISGWAWGLSRVMDFLEEEKFIDESRVSVIGHSRLGKTSLWAGASDPRFALVISNNSGCGGAALSKRKFGETVKRINTSFPHWFCNNFKQYNDKEENLPFDQHILMSLIAPRPLYVASASKDLWADPLGEFLSVKYADPVYRMLTGEGLPSKKMPGTNKPIQGRIGYHLREGKHDITNYDWQNYIKFANKHLK